MVKLRRLVRTLTTAFYFLTFVTQAVLISVPALKVGDPGWIEANFSNVSGGEVLTCGGRGVAYFPGGNRYRYSESFAKEVGDVSVPVVAQALFYSAIALVLLLSYIWRSRQTRTKSIDTGCGRLQRSDVMQDFDYTVMGTPNAMFLAIRSKRRQPEAMPADLLVPSFSKITKRSRKRQVLLQRRKGMMLLEGGECCENGVLFKASVGLARMREATEQLNDTGYFSEKSGGSADCNESPCGNRTTLRTGATYTGSSALVGCSVVSAPLTPCIREERAVSPAIADMALKCNKSASQSCGLTPTTTTPHAVDSVDDRMQREHKSDFIQSSESSDSAHSKLDAMFYQYRRSNMVDGHGTDPNSFGDIGIEKIMTFPRSNDISPEAVNNAISSLSNSNVSSASTDSFWPASYSSKQEDRLQISVKSCDESSFGISQLQAESVPSANNAAKAVMPIESRLPGSTGEIGSGDAPELGGSSERREKFVKTSSKALPIAPRPYDPNEEHFFKIPSFISLPKTSGYTESYAPPSDVASKSYDGNQMNNSRNGASDLDMDMTPDAKSSTEQASCETGRKGELTKSKSDARAGITGNNTKPSLIAIEPSAGVVSTQPQAECLSQESVSCALEVEADKSKSLPSVNDEQTGDGGESKHADAAVATDAEVEKSNPKECCSEEILSVGQLRKELSAIADRERKLTEQKITEAKESAAKDLDEERHAVLGQIKKKQVKANRAIRQKFDDCLRPRQEALGVLRVQKDIIARETGKVRQIHNQWNDASDRVEEEKRSRERHQYYAGLEKIRQYEISIVTCVLKAMELRRVFQGMSAERSAKEPRCYDCCTGKHRVLVETQTTTFRKVFHDDLEPRKPPTLLRESNGFPSSCPIVHAVNSQYRALNLTEYVPMSEKIDRISKMQKRLQWDLFRRPYLNEGRLSS